MTSGNWMNSDGLYIQYGTSKATPATAGDYLSYGETREIELTVDLTTLTTSAVIQDNVTFVPTNCLIEQVEVIADTAATGGTSFSVGLVKLDRSTAVSTTAFVAAMVLASVDAAGEKTILTAGSTYAGTKIGTTVGSDPGYLTALAAGTFTAGVVKVRIKYRGIGTITQ